MSFLHITTIDIQSSTAIMEHKTMHSPSELHFVQLEHSPGFQAYHTYGVFDKGCLLHGEQLQKLASGQVRLLVWLYGELHSVDGKVVHSVEQCYLNFQEKQMIAYASAFTEAEDD